MSAQPSPSTTQAVPAAPAAFLRGVERRAAVLAELQAGDARTGDAALATAMACFLAEAPDAAMAQWPRLFWSMLLAQPVLRERRQPATGGAGHLDSLGTAPRAVLLLRLAAGLDEADAAAVLGLARPTYRLALQRALPHHADGRPDPQAWRQLHATVQARLRALDAPRLQGLAQARDAALLGRARPAAVDTLPSSEAPERPRRLLAVLWGLLGLCVLAMAATFVQPQRDVGVAAEVRREALPEADAPAAALDPESARIAHPDFALLADPEGERLAADADFAAWVAAQSAAGAGLEGALAPVAPVEDAEPVSVPSDLPESSDAPL